MEDAFVITGGKPLKGEVQLSGAKNVALKVLIASLFFDATVTFTNIPDIADIRELIHLMSDLGVDCTLHDNHTLTVNPSGLQDKAVDLLHGSKIRSSFMLFGPLLYRFGKAHIPNPGGCRLGARPIDRQVDMLEGFGVDVGYDSTTGYYEAKLKESGLVGNEYTFVKPTHTGTELAIMIASVAHGETIIKNAAGEPEIDDLIQFLNNAGARIKREGNTIHVIGVKALKPQDTPYHIMYDRNEAPTYAAFALATKGDIVIKGVVRSQIDYFIKQVRLAGGGVEETEKGIRFYYKGELKSTNVETRPHPGFMTDWQGPWAVVMTQADGISTIHETVFEDRFGGYVAEMRKTGAKIDFFQPKINNPDSLYQFNVTDPLSLKQAIRISGPTKLHNGVLTAQDLRAGATVLIAAAVAEGESYVLSASTIDRGYEHIEKKLAGIGAVIKRV